MAAVDVQQQVQQVQQVDVQLVVEPAAATSISTRRSSISMLRSKVTAVGASILRSSFILSLPSLD
jgi:hypothetical protein